jgi:hypothetical protein
VRRKQVFIVGAHPMARRNAVQAVQNAPEGDCVTVGEPTRSLEQNAAQWPILEAFAEQLEWPINGRMSRLTAEDWKDLLSAAFKREQARVAPGLDGGMVLLGQRTSQFCKKEFSEWLEFLHATAVDRGVVVYAEAA